MTQPSLTPSRLMRTGMMRIGLLLAALVLLADQTSKYWILNGLDLPSLGSIAVLPGLNLTMVWNHGVTFGMFNGLGRAGPLLLTGVAMIVIVLLGFWLRGTDSRRIAIGLGMIAGGAIGNVADRLRLGAVVDFIHLHAFGWSWYVFNVADAAIDCGVCLLLLDSLLERKRA